LQFFLVLAKPVDCLGMQSKVHHLKQ
jgi:hypothetical protein